MNYFILFSCCIPVKGVKRAILCDLQRDKFDFIPIALYNLLIHFSLKGKSIENMKDYFENKQDGIIEEYFKFLVGKEYGYLTDKENKLPKINLSELNESKKITNAIVDFSIDSVNDLNVIIPQLSELYCEAIELRFFYIISIESLCKKLNSTNGSTLRDVEVLIEYSDVYSIENILKIRKEYARLRKITIFNSPNDKIYEHEEIVIIFTQQKINTESCGIVNPWYFISKTETFIEFKRFNSCLNKKISIDIDGNIKNCPSMKKSFGKIVEKSLKEVIENSDFTSLWTINKDKIKICKVCEFRYVCQDCRAYIVNQSDICSKPLKCKYNPYE